MAEGENLTVTSRLLYHTRLSQTNVSNIYLLHFRANVAELQVCTTATTVTSGNTGHNAWMIPNKFHCYLVYKQRYVQSRLRSVNLDFVFLLIIAGSVRIRTIEKD